MNSARQRVVLPLLAILAALVGCDGGGRGELTTGRPVSVRHETRPWDVGPGGGQELITRHYHIYTTVRRPEMAHYLPGFLEAAYRNYLTITGLADEPVDEKLPVYMMSTRQEWASLTKSIVGPQWDIYSRIQAGGYCYQGVCVFWDMGGTGSLSVAAHEGLHQFVGRRLTDGLPMWMEEGMAAMSEGYEIDGATVRFTPDRNPSRFGDLRKAIVNDWWIPLERLLKMDAGDALTESGPERGVGYYGQLWALVLMLRTHPEYRDRWQRMLRDAEAGRFHQTLGMSAERLAATRRRGRSYNRTMALPLFTKYITPDLAAFESEYKRFARRLVRLP